MNQQLSWRTIVGYSLGDVANNFAFAMGALFLLSYYTDVAGVGAAAAGTMLLLVRVLDAFADVFAGRVVDSVNTRWGKFRPFLLFGTAPLMIFSVLVFWVPTDWSHSSKVVYAYLTYMGLGLCYSLVNIPLWFTCYRDDPTTTIPRPSGRGSRDCRFINLCLPGISDRTEH